MNKHFTFIIAALACLSLSQDALATVRRVTPTGTSTTSGSAWTDAAAFGNLQTAINASASGDTLWVKAGTYQKDTVSTSFRMKQGVVMLGGFNGTETAATARNWTTNATILRGNSATVILNNFTSGGPMTSSSVLDGFTVTGGKSSSYSGGMHNVYASPTVINCQFLRDTAQIMSQGYGGGMGNINSSPVVSNTLFKQCYAAYSGGGICNSNGSGVFTNIVVDSNTVGYYGGGIGNWNGGTPVFTNLIISNNISMYGGGGMCNVFSGTTTSVVNAVFINNKTSSTYGGGGFWNYIGTSSLTNVTFVGNSADRGGAVSSTNGGTINIKNTTFWNNTASVANPDIAVSGTGGGTGTANTTYSFTQASITGTGNILGTASPFVDIATPMGADGTWMTEDDGLRPFYSSPIRDAGTATGAPATDILGKPRPGGAGFDMGAYESSLRLYVKADATGANDGSNWTNAYTSLQQAIDSSKAGGEIWIAAGTYKPSKDAFGSTTPSDNRDKTFYIRDSVKIYGGFNGTENSVATRAGLFSTTIISGDLGSTPTTYTDDAYHVMLSVNSSAATQIDGVTIEKGNASLATNSTVSTYSIPRNGGAGIYLANTLLTISNVILRDNRAGFGGAIYANSGAPVLTKNWIKNNTVTVQGGAMFNTNAQPVISACVFEANTANNGGALSSFGGTGYTILLENSIFRANVGTNLGGALDDNVNIVARNTVFSNNTSGVNGGGAIYHNSAGLTVQNVIFNGNSTTGSGADIRVFAGTSAVTYSYTQTSITGTGNILGTTDPFLNNAYPKGPDSLWMTSDDGLQLPFCSNLVNVGNNTGVATTDILGRPRINSTTVDLGAYEKQSNVVDYEYNAKLSTNSANTLPFIKTCDDGEWTYYADPTSPDSLSFGIAWGASNATAKAAATMSLVVDTANTAATTTTDGIWTMRRYWNVNLGATSLAAPVKVRFYYNPADTVALRAAANAWNTTYGSGLYTISPVKWFKTTTGAFTPSMVAATDINGGNKKVLSPVYGNDNGVAYVQFDTVTSFSGGTAAIGGQAGAAALPVALISYIAQYAANGASVLNSWTVGEESALRYNVQRSTDAQHFETVGSVAATHNHNYAYTDQLPASVKGQQLYYRLAIVDADNSLSYSNVVRLSAGKAAAGALTIAPNPVSSSFTIVNTDAGRNGQEAVITDLFGTVISRITIAAELSVTTQSWLPGVYILRLADATVYRIVKQ